MFFGATDPRAFLLDNIALNWLFAKQLQHLLMMLKLVKAYLKGWDQIVVELLRRC